LCWFIHLVLLRKQNYVQCLYTCDLQKSCNSRVHVHNVQVCYICILMPCWCAAPINSSFPLSVSFTSV
uniref:Uncharacterized protein n=1 Tax=Macaca fascicularis TaxID=9541 RepID=A0A7N9DAN5_MACFA